MNDDYTPHRLAGRSNNNSQLAFLHFVFATTPATALSFGGFGVKLSGEKPYLEAVYWPHSRVAGLTLFHFLGVPERQPGCHNSDRLQPYVLFIISSASSTCVRTSRGSLELPGLMGVNLSNSLEPWVGDPRNSHLPREMGGNPVYSLDSWV